MGKLLSHFCVPLSLSVLPPYVQICQAFHALSPHVFLYLVSKFIPSHTLFLLSFYLSPSPNISLFSCLSFPFSFIVYFSSSYLSFPLHILNSLFLSLASLSLVYTRLFCSFLSFFRSVLFSSFAFYSLPAYSFQTPFPIHPVWVHTAAPHRPFSASIYYLHHHHYHNQHQVVDACVVALWLLDPCANTYIQTGTHIRARTHSFIHTSDGENIDASKQLNARFSPSIFLSLCDAYAVGCSSSKRASDRAERRGRHRVLRRLMARPPVSTKLGAWASERHTRAKLLRSTEEKEIEGESTPARAIFLQAGWSLLHSAFIPPPNPVSPPLAAPLTFSVLLLLSAGRTKK